MQISFLELVGNTLEDFTLIVLIVSGVASIVLEQLFGTGDNGWIEGAAILAAVAVVALVTAVNDYEKEQQFRELSALSSETEVLHWHASNTALWGQHCTSCIGNPFAMQGDICCISACMCTPRREGMPILPTAMQEVHDRPKHQDRGLRDFATAQVTVVRDGQAQEVGTGELLVGDVMLLSTGDILPADGMLFEGNDIRRALIFVHPVPEVPAPNHHGPQQSCLCCSAAWQLCAPK